MPSRPSHALRAWAPPAAWAVLILCATSVPGSALPEAPLGDKTWHVLAYLPLGVLCARAVGRTRPGRTLRAGLLAAAAIVAFAALDEAHQALIPGRFPDPCDALADVAGAWAGLAAWLGLRGGLRRRAPRRNGPGPGEGR
ncbi:MAG: VanZ family protein [Deltaproteobacteria bacterium]|nr:VanZ family protein [Deltaproteobacteria bacterium]